MPSNEIDSIRIRCSFAIRQLLSTEILGEVPRTQQITSPTLHSAFATETPVRIMAFGGAPSPFPYLKTSMVLTAVVTMYALQFLNPQAQADVVSSQQVAMFPPPGWVMPNHPSLPPEEQRRLDRIQRLHSAAENAANSSGSSVSSDSSASSESSEVSQPSDTSKAASGQTLPTPVQPTARYDNKRGIFLTASSVAREKFFNDTVDALVAAGGNAIIFDVKGGGVLFHSAAPLANQVGIVRNLYDLPTIIKKLHDRNIYVMGRFVAIKDDAYTTAVPASRIKNPKTGAVLSQTWVDPSDDNVIEYNMQVVCELASAGIDEINLDYIRFSTSEFGALGVYSAEQKADRVEKFIKAARDTINRCGPNTKLGLSTFAILGWDYDVNVRTLGQDVRRFAPLVDVISPMAYPASFKSAGYYIPGKNPGPRDYWLVYRTLTGYAKLLGPDESKKLRPWIQGYSVTNKDVSDEIRAVYDAGVCGFQVWNANNNYAPTYTAIKNDVQRPDRCVDEPKI